MRNGDLDRLPAYQAVPFASSGEVAVFLRELETASILVGRPSDGTVSLDAMARCLHDLGRPDHAYRSIHVTGTNGKTTVSRMLVALLRASGRSIGLFASAVHGQFRERITLDGRPISEQEFVDACSHVKRFMDWQGVRLTAFEFLTAAAFFAFRAARVDYAVIEVGVGGRQDATNVIAPDVALITNVDYDHMDLLGDTLEQIAAEKAGIVKPLTPIVCGAMADGPRDVIRARAAGLHAPLLEAGREYEVVGFTPLEVTSRCTVRVGGRTWADIPLNSPAGVMATNAAHALATYDVLRRRGLVADLTEADVQAAFAQADLAGCCEVLPGQPAVLLDGSHNAPAAAQLAAMLRTAFEGRRLVLLLALPSHTEHEAILRRLADARIDRVIATRFAGHGTLDPHQLTQDWHRCSSAAAEAVPTSDLAWARALHAAGPRGLVVVTGSIQWAAYCRTLHRQMASAAVTTA